MSAVRLAFSVAIVAALGSLAACGKRSDLDTTYQAEIDARKDAQRAGQALPPEPEKPVEDKPFVLDPLL